MLYEVRWEFFLERTLRWRRIVFSFAFVVVFFTAIVVAFCCKLSYSWIFFGIRFLLGGIVSPPDAVKCRSYFKICKNPEKIPISILEGESLLNDASSSLFFAFALIAVATGQFIWHQAIMDFIWMCRRSRNGILIAFLFAKMHKLLPTDANMDTIFTLVAPFIMYPSWKNFTASGVLSVVSGGLFYQFADITFLVEHRGSQHKCLQSFSFTNGMVFMLIGLDLPLIVLGPRTPAFIKQLCGVVITEFLLSLECSPVMERLFHVNYAKFCINVADNRVSRWKVPIVLGWAGMRGWFLGADFQYLNLWRTEVHFTVTSSFSSLCSDFTTFSFGKV